MQLFFIDSVSELEASLTYMMNDDEHKEGSLTNYGLN